MSVGIEFWVPEFGGDAFLEPLRDKVFESLRLFVYLFNRVVEHLIKKGLNKPMVPQHFQSAPLSLLRQPHPAMPLILDKGLGRGRQLLQHIRNGSRRHSESVRQRAARYLPILRLAQGEYCLQIVVYRLRSIIRLAARCHCPTPFLQLDFFFILGEPKN